MSRGREILSTSDLSIGYKTTGKEMVVMKHLSLSAGHGELVALIGRNGTGKSTLLRSLASLQLPLDGSIILKGERLSEISSGELPRIISFTSTEPFSVHNIKVREAVALGRFPYTNWLGSLSEEDERCVYEALEVTGMLTLADRNIDNISDGERQRTLIARSLAQDTDLLIMDEPTAFLDLPSRFGIVSLLRKLTRERGKCVIYSTHDLDSAINEADSIWLMTEAGIQQGAPEDLILSKSLAKAFKSPMLSFSSSTGTFSFIRTGAGEIALEANGFYRKMTEKALQRCGYNINPNARTKITVNAIEENVQWCLTEGERMICCSSIYELVNHLPEEAVE